MNYCVYILKSLKDNKFYIGQTSDLEKRVKAHQRGSVPSTRHRRPLQLIYKEGFDSASEATRREREIKNYKNTEKFLSYHRE